MQEWEFLPLRMSGRLLTYEYQSIKQVRVVDKIEAQRSMLPPTTKLDTRADARIARLFEKEPQAFERTAYDTQLSRFYLVEDCICGALLVRKPNDHEIYISDIYLNPVAEKNSMFLILLADLLIEIREQVGEVFDVHMKIDNPKLYDNIIQLFGMPEQYEYAQEWTMPTVKK